jgi:hypothetical protein
MMRAMRFTLAAAALLALAASPAAAQQVGNTDASGPILTGSGSAGGSYLGAGLRSENELFGRLGDDVVFRNARIGCAVRGAVNAWRDSVARETHTPAEQRVFDLLIANEGSPGADAVAAALARGADGGSPLGTLARRLANALGGLMKDRGGCAESRQEYTEAPQWQEAIEAFKAYVRDAPDSAFAPPAPELIAIHAALQSVVSGALRQRDAR